MDYFLRNSSSRYIKNQMDFNKHDLAIFLCDMWQKYSKCKVTSTLNEITKVCPEDKTHHWVSFVRFETFVNPFAKDCG
jgi:hypothetical protein